MTRPIHTAPTDGTEIIVGDTSPAWEHRVRWERNGFAIDRERFAENPTYWRPVSPAPDASSWPAEIMRLKFEIDRLQRELEKARAALREIANKAHYPDEGIARRALASAEQKQPFAPLGFDARRPND